MSEQQTEKKILLFKLASGEEVISRMVSDELYFYLDSPQKILSYPDQASGQMRVGLIPFLGYAEEDGVVLSRIGTHFAIPSEAMQRTYISAVSGIQIPDSSIQLH